MKKVWQVIAVCALFLFVTTVLIVSLSGSEVKNVPKASKTSRPHPTCVPGRYTPVAEMITTVPNATVYLVPDPSIIIYQDDEDNVINL